MSVIATLIEPRRVTRVFFDCRCRDVAADSADLRRIERAIESSIAAAQLDDDGPESFPLAA
jgi:hypothetical protein